MKIKVKRLPRVKLADLLEKYGLELVVTQIDRESFESEVKGIYRTERAQHGGVYSVLLVGVGISAHDSIVNLCGQMTGARRISIDRNGDTEWLGLVDVVPPDASEIEEVP